MAIGQRSLQGFWLKALLFVLFGYALLGKGLAYLFLGEMILVAGFFIFLKSKRIMLAFSDNVLLLWALFALWGFCRTVPFLHKYGFDAVRDAVLWGYGTFALLIVAFVNSSSQISRALDAYRKFIRWYLPVLPFLVIVTAYGFLQYLPSLPWAPGIAIIFLKGGDAAVHLAGAGVFLLLFPNRPAGSRRQKLPVIVMIGAAGWFITAMVILASTRGGALAVILPIVFVSLLKAREIGWKVVAYVVLWAALAVVILGSNMITITHHGRTVTLDQVLENVSSIGGHVKPSGDTEGTKEWRLAWWGNIVRYTVFGPYRWTGKGFGVNLALEGGPPGMPAETDLRSPHNGNMTVLARMGVPGLAIWVVLNSVFVFRLFKANRFASRSGSLFWSRLNLWIFSYWFAAFVNLSFDVYLEGPQGGILFWSIIGFGVAALRVQTYEARLLEAAESSAPEESPAQA